MTADVIATARAFQRGVRRPTEVTYGAMLAVVEHFEAKAYLSSAIAANVDSMRRSASTLVPMLRSQEQIREAWLEERRELPLWERLRTPRRPPSWFADEWHESLVTEGRTIFAEELARAEEWEETL